MSNNLTNERDLTTVVLGTLSGTIAVAIICGLFFGLVARVAIWVINF